MSDREFDFDITGELSDWENLANGPPPTVQKVLMQKEHTSPKPHKTVQDSKPEKTIGISTSYELIPKSSRGILKYRVRKGESEGTEFDRNPNFKGEQKTEKDKHRAQLFAIENDKMENSEVKWDVEENDKENSRTRSNLGHIIQEHIHEEKEAKEETKKEDMGWVEDYSGFDFGFNSIEEDDTEVPTKDDEIIKSAIYTQSLNSSMSCLDELTDAQENTASEIKVTKYSRADVNPIEKINIFEDSNIMGILKDGLDARARQGKAPFSEDALRLDILQDVWRKVKSSKPKDEEEVKWAIRNTIPTNAAAEPYLDLVIDSGLGLIFDRPPPIATNKRTAQPFVKRQPESPTEQARRRVTLDNSILELMAVQNDPKYAQYAHRPSMPTRAPPPLPKKPNFEFLSMDPNPSPPQPRTPSRPRPPIPSCVPPPRPVTPPYNLPAFQPGPSFTRRQNVFGDHLTVPRTDQYNLRRASYHSASTQNVGSRENMPPMFMPPRPDTAFAASGGGGFDPSIGYTPSITPSVRKRDKFKNLFTSKRT